MSLYVSGDLQPAVLLVPELFLLKHVLIYNLRLFHVQRFDGKNTTQGSHQDNDVHDCCVGAAAPKQNFWELCHFDPQHNERGISFVSQHSTAFTLMLEICLEVLEGKKCQREKTCGGKHSPSKKAKKKNDPGMKDMECVWSLQSPGDTVGKLSAGWTAAESRRAEWEEEEGGGILQR